MHNYYNRRYYLLTYGNTTCNTTSIESLNAIFKHRRYVLKLNNHAATYKQLNVHNYYTTAALFILPPEITESYTVQSTLFYYLLTQYQRLRSLSWVWSGLMLREPLVNYLTILNYLSRMNHWRYACYIHR